MITEQLQTARQLGQGTPANTTAVAIYSPRNGIKGEIGSIIVCNTGTNIIKYRIFHDADGSTYADASALFYDVTLGSGETDIICFKEIGLIVDGDTDGTLGIRTDTADDMTVTLYGWELSK